MYYRLSIYSRFFSKSSQFFDICRESWNEFEKWKRRISKIQEEANGQDLEEGWSRFLGLSALMDESYVKAIVFAAMCLEGFVYDYAATTISGSYAKNYLDRLDLVSKYVVIPRIVTGKKFPTDTHAFQHLKELVDKRNDFVHYKSKRVPTDKELEKMLKESLIQTERKGKKKGSYELNPYQTIIEVLTELRKLDGDVEQRWWQLEEVPNRVDYLKQK